MGGSLPKGSTRHGQIVRQWKVLLLLDANRHGLTIHELATRVSADVSVTERTLRRDIDALTLAGFPIDVKTRGHASVFAIVTLDRRQWQSGASIFDPPTVAQ